MTEEIRVCKRCHKGRDYEMGCGECERWQNEGKVSISQIFYFRVHNTHVGIVACPRHISAIVSVVRNHLDEIDELANEPDDIMLRRYKALQ